MTAGWHFVALKPDASCVPDTLSSNLPRAVLGVAVLHVTSSLAVPLQDSLLLSSRIGPQASELRCQHTRLRLSVFWCGETGKGPPFSFCWWSG